MEFNKSELLAIYNALCISTAIQKQQAETKRAAPFLTGLKMEIAAYEELARDVAAYLSLPHAN